MLPSSSRDQDDSFLPPAGSIAEAQEITRVVSASIDPVIQRLAEQARDDEIKLAYLRHATCLSLLIKEVEEGLAAGEGAAYFQRIHDGIQRHRNAIRDIQRTQLGRSA